MKPQAVFIIKLTVTGKLRTAFLFCPLLTFCQQFRSISFSAVFFRNKYAFQISDRGAFCAFHIIIPKLTLRKRNRAAADLFEKAGCISILYQFTERFCQFIGIIVLPQLYRHCRKYICIIFVCSFNHHLPVSCISWVLLLTSILRTQRALFWGRGRRRRPYQRCSLFPRAALRHGLRSRDCRIS